MKRVALHFFAVVLCFCSYQAVASHAALNVQSQTLRFNVSINKALYQHNRSFFTMDDMLPGRYRVQVWNDMPTHRHYGMIAPAALYDAWVVLKPYETFTVTVERGGYVRTYSTVACPAPVIAPAPVCHQPDFGYYDSYSYPAPAPIYYGMAPDAFQSLKHAVINRSFDSTKRELLASALRNNQVTSAQLYELINLLDFESSKVEIAKIGYASVVDKQNFYRVYEAFSFDSSVTELQRYIG